MHTDYSNFKARQKGEYEKAWQSTGKCVFCDLRDKYIIYEKNGVVLTTNLFPYIDGHLMVIPRRHSETIQEVTVEEWAEFKHIIEIGSELLKKTLKIKDVWVLYRIGEGYRAGKSVVHSHIHLIPYSLDLIKMEYQELNISPQELAEKLRKTLKKNETQ